MDEAIAGCRQRGLSDENCRKGNERELPRHRVVLDAFYIDKNEATNALFERFEKATGHRTTAEREGFGWTGQEKDDVVTPELLAWAVWREFKTGGTPTELVARLRHFGLATGNVETLAVRVTEMLEEMMTWSAQRRVERLNGGRYRAFLESD